MKSRRDRILFIEPLYTLALENPNYDPDNNDPSNPQFLLRPGAKEFITKVAQVWEIIIFSSRKKELVWRLVDVLDPLKAYVKFVLHRNNCAITQHKRCVKDLAVVQNAGPCALVLDYKPQNVAFSLDHALLALHWNGAEDDSELLTGLAPYLDLLAKQPDPLRFHQDKAGYPAFLAKIYKPGQTGLINNS